MRERFLGLHPSAGSSLKQFALPTSYPHYPPDRPLDLQHIAITIRPDFEREVITGVASLRLLSKRDGVSRLTLDAADFDVKSVSLQGQGPIRFNQEGDKLVVDLPLPTKASEVYELLVEYKGRPSSGLYFRKPDKDRPNRPTQLWTQGEDELSHHWFPCIDTPAQKVTSEVVATVPSSMTAISNGKLLSVVTDESKEERTFHWRQDLPHSVYLISLVVGEYVELKEEVEGVPLSYFVYRGREEDARRSFSETPEILKFYVEKTGMKYPWDKYAQTVVNDFIFGGMENTSATTLTDTTLHDERAHIDFSSVPLIAHELAHMWFGDLLTCKHWSHAWLNESFATFFETLYQEHSRGREEYVRSLQDDMSAYLEEYEKHYARPIVTNNYETPGEMFDRHLYEKGCLVLNMLRARLGDVDFFRSIQTYVKDNAFGSVESSDLARAVEKTTGINLDGFFEQWLYRPGHPILSVSYSAPGGTEATLRVQQTQDEDAFKFELKAVVTYPKSSDTYLFPVTSKDQTFYIPLRESPLFVSVDPDFSLLATIEFERPREMMLRQLESDTVAGRCSAARGLAKDGSLAAALALKKALLGEGFWGVRAECAKALGDIGNESAMNALIECLGVEHPKVRRAVAQALGKFRKEQAAAALAGRLESGDSSYFVEGELARSLGKTRQPQFEGLLIRSLSKPSYNETIQVGALDGLANLGAATSVDAVVERTRQKYPNNVRQAAAQALGKLGTGRKDISDVLVLLLKDEWFRVRSAAAQALAERKETEAAREIEAALAVESDGRVRRAFHEALASLRALSSDQEVKQLRDDLERLKEENRLLKERIDRLETELGRSKKGRAKRP